MTTSTYVAWPLRPGQTAVLVLLLALGLSACRTTYPPPTGEVSSARAAVTSAEEAGAAEHAPVEFRRARQKLEQSRQAEDRGDNMQARMLAEQAEVDARLAEITARAARQEAAVESMRASMTALQEEIERSRRAAQQEE